MVLATEAEETKSKERASLAISFDSVSKRYYKDLALLDEVSFDLPYGELLAIIGPSGSGKSTILQMASALLSPDGGKITIDGAQIFPRSKKNAAREEDRLRRSLISYIPQEDFLLESLTVFENVALALDLFEDSDNSDRDKKVKHAMEEVGIDQLGDRMIYQISAGERRRCAISRALVRNPRILIADEPTASLDIEKTNELMKLLKSKQDQEEKEGRKMAILIASHDVVELEPFADKLYEIRNATLSQRKRDVVV
ncbi:MAG: ABC transporter ATP-binding protein [archaeon]|nr:ABC transporter ATP-binding protein [archaeon]